MAEQRWGKGPEAAVLPSARVKSPVDAVCRPVNQPSYQSLRYHTVERLQPCPPKFQAVSPEQQPVEAVYSSAGQQGKQVPADRRQILPGSCQGVKRAAAVAAVTVEQPVASHSLKNLDREMTLGELFQK